MKKTYSYFSSFIKVVLLILSFCTSSLFTFAQNSSAHRKSSNAYRNNYQRIATGSTSESTFEIRDDGTLWAWGRNDKGQLGDNTLVDKSTPTQIGFEDNWVSITAAYDYTLGIKANGTLWAWGNNEVGQLGDGTILSKTIPTQISTDNNWVSVATGGTITVALKSDGTLWSWGYYAYNGPNMEGSNVPVQVGTNNNWASISTGNSVPLAIKSDGTLWGLNSNANTMYATQIGTDNDWVKSSTSSYHTVAIKSNGTIWTWGNNMFGQLGNGNTIDNHTPMQMGIDDNWVDVEVGDAHNIALKSDGTLWAWGDNRNGQLGDGTETNKLDATQIGLGTNWVDMVAGEYHTLGVKADGTIWAWGKNANGELGDGTTIDKNVPKQVSYNSSGVLSAALGLFHTSAIKTDGTLWTWGSTPYSELNDGHGSLKQKPTQIGIDKNWSSVVSGQDYSVAIKSDGTLWAWGSNNFGQLGSGDFDYRSTPVQIGSDNDWVNIATGNGNLFAIKSNGSLWSCGSNGYSVLGYSTIRDESVTTLMQVGTDNSWVSVSGGYAHCFGLKSDGTIWGWGKNYDGQLGDGTSQNWRVLPIQIGTERNWISIKAANDYTLAIKSDGTLWAWGDNTNFRLGDQTNIPRHTPTQIGVDNNWICIEPEIYNTKAIKSDGTLWAWGTISSNREWGDGTFTSKNKPTIINNLSNIISLASTSYDYHIAIIRSNRSSLCLMGDNSFGQLGDGTTTDKNTFNCIPLLSSTVPLQLTNYLAKLTNNSVINTWQTANEINVSHINVQRSTDGVNFVNIGKVNPKGGGMYSFSDGALPANINTLYYRLETVDMSGTSEISNVQAVKLLFNSSASLSIFPNPVTSKQFNLKMDKLPKGIYQISISDTGGKIVKKLNFSYDGTTLTKTIFSDFPVGVYLLKVSSGNYSETRKLLVN